MAAVTEAAQRRSAPMRLPVGVTPVLSLLQRAALPDEADALISAYMAWEFDRDAQPLVDVIVAALRALTTLYDKRAPLR